MSELTWSKGTHPVPALKGRSRQNREKRVRPHTGKFDPILSQRNASTSFWAEAPELTKALIQFHKGRRRHRKKRKVLSTGNLPILRRP